MSSIQVIVLICYIISSVYISMYSVHYYLLLFLNLTKHKKSKDDINLIIDNYDQKHYPHVTIQLPVYNEINVIERLINSAVKLDYPHDLFDIQILDDSTDNTTGELYKIIEKIRSEKVFGNIEINVIRRNNRLEYKAGALQNGLCMAKGDYTAIFDSDFIIPENFLKRTVPLIESDNMIACVQTRWGYLNRYENLVTKAVSIGIDGHFAVEQGARFYNNLFLNFNGTGGIWRKEAILKSGGWQGDTLTEDMDLSYRSQLNGYKIIYDFDTECISEIPNNLIDFKSQQHRWAKGSVQTALKLLPKIFASREISLSKKIESYFHMTHYILSIFMVFHCIITLPFLALVPVNTLIYSLFPLWFFIILTSFAPLTLYMGSGIIVKKPLFFITHIPLLLLIGSGACINNTKAIIEALFGFKSEFIRTPKTGSTDKKKLKSKYRLDSSLIIGFFEIVIGLYSLFTAVFLFKKNINFYVLFILINAVGFLMFGINSIFRNILCRLSKAE